MSNSRKRVDSDGVLRVGLHRIFVWLGVLSCLLLITSGLMAQSLTTGDIAGTLKDPSGAVIPNATVTLKSLDTGATQTQKTGGVGEFRFRLLQPGHYQLTVEQAGFQKMEQAVNVAVGSISTADLMLRLSGAVEVVEATAVAPLVNPDPSVNTNFTSQQLAQLPVAGGDITGIAFTVPGVVVNVTGGYGNFTLNGLPATSNLYTVNGENDMDPYFNINNSGASNLTIGANEMAEATVIANPYSGQYGQLAGAQVTMITKSGTNAFHGNAVYWWNGRMMNSNNWFFNATGTERPFSNANQWAASVGGPVIKDKTFFFVDTEGFRFVLPNVFTNTIPSKEFTAAVLNNIQAKQPAEYNAYKQLFGLWANAPGAAGAEPLANSSACKALTLTGFNPATQNCALRYNTSTSTLGNEWILAFRVDQRIGANDNAYFRYKGDHGLQPTYLDPISHAFDALSAQPSYDMQFAETHIFGPRVTNSYMMTFSHYVAQFQQNVANVTAAWPYGRLTTGSPVPFTGFNPQSSFPQGRNITQYQFIDDVAYIRGRHNLKFGMNFRRYDVSDHNFFYTYPRVYFSTASNAFQRFVDGLAYRYTKSQNLSNNVPIAMWGLGMYAQDEWNVKSNLKLTLALRAERNSNPVCQFNCFANFIGPTTSLPSFTSANPGNVPYSNDIQSGLHQAYPGVDALVLSPRVGFNWSPTQRTVVSGGFMLAYDNPPAGLVDNLLANPPISVQFRVQPTAGTAPFDPNGAPATWAASAAAFSLNKTYSQISSQLAALGASFAAPSFSAINGTIHAPRWKEWNLMIQRQLSNDTVLSLNYVGNAGDRILYGNAWPNAFDQYGLYPGVPGIPAKVPVPNYGLVTQFQNGAISNSNGLSVILTKRFSKMFMAHFSYTWAHNLDEVSNGGVFTYGDSVLGQINPLSLRANNYGNSDYDIRHNFSGDFIFNPTFHVTGPVKYIVNGWELGGKIFWRTGLPFSVFDGNSALGNGGGSILAQPLGTGWGQSNCTAKNALITGDEPGCINPAAYLDSSTIDNFTRWSPQTRNQLHGPHFFDLDLSLYKNFKIKERVGFAVGMMAFNALNHPNFGLPSSDISDTTGFGKISGMQGSPLSPYGTFLGFDSSVRVVQLTGKITF